MYTCLKGNCNNIQNPRLQKVKALIDMRMWFLGRVNHHWTIIKHCTWGRGVHISQVLYPSLNKSTSGVVKSILFKFN